MTASKKITPFIMFNDQAEEAMGFYTSIFPNSKIVATMPGAGGKIMGGTFEIEGERFSCFNAGPHPNFKFSQGISFMIYVDTQDEVDHYYDKLSEGGEQQPCGWVADKFGVSWQVTPTILMKAISDPKTAGPATEAMLKMHKIIIADIEASIRQ